MSLIRFIHTADLHLDSPFKGLERLPSYLLQKVKESTFTSFKNIVNLAIDEKVDFILVTGDIFDSASRSLKAQTKFRNEMERLKEHNIEAFISHGNHDHLSGSWVELVWPSNVHIFHGGTVECKKFEKGEVVVHLYGFSYPQREVKENMTDHYKKVPGANYHIGMLHGNVSGNEEHDPYAPFTIGELLNKDFSYWALGHIHKREILHKDPHIIYPGNIQGRHRKETDEKGCYLIEIAEQNTKAIFKHTAPIEWHNVSISINNISSYDQLLQSCEEAIEQTRKQTSGTMVHLTINGTGILHELLMKKDVIDDLIEHFTEGEKTRENFVYIVSCKVFTAEEWDRDKLKEQAHFTGELLTALDKADNFDGATKLLLRHRKAKRYLNNFNEEQKNEIYNRVETLLLTELLKKS